MSTPPSPHFSINPHQGRAAAAKDESLVVRTNPESPAYPIPTVTFYKLSDIPMDEITVARPFLFAFRQSVFLEENLSL